MFTNLREMLIHRTLYKNNTNKSKLYTQGLAKTCRKFNVYK